MLNPQKKKTSTDILVTPKKKLQWGGGVAQVTAQEEMVFPRLIKQGSAFNTEISHHRNKNPPPINTDTELN